MPCFSATFFRYGPISSQETRLFFFVIKGSLRIFPSIRRECEYQQLKSRTISLFGHLPIFSRKIVFIWGLPILMFSKNERLPAVFLSSPICIPSSLPHKILLPLGFFCCFLSLPKFLHGEFFKGVHHLQNAVGILVILHWSQEWKKHPKD